MPRDFRRLSRIVAGVLISGACLAQVPGQAPDQGGEALPTFGVTVVTPYGFCGRVFALPVGHTAGSAGIPELEDPRPSTGQGRVVTHGPVETGSGNDCSTRLPEFQKLQPLGQIYTNQLHVPPQDFRAGFPGVTGRFEWFAIEYTARFWIEKPGKYSFMLLSDDGSALYIDERRIIDNDCTHAPLSVTGNVRLEGGLHDMRVGYFQGPRWQVALILYVRPPEEGWRVFNTDEFKPPPDPADWKYPNTANLDNPEDPCKAERRTKKLMRRSRE